MYSSFCSVTFGMRDLANNLATPRLCRDRQNGFLARKGGKSETGRKPQVMASFPSHTRLSGGGDMGRRKRRRVDPTDDWQQLELLCVWEEQREYGKSDQTLKKEVKEVLFEHGINHGSLNYSTHTNPIRIRGKRITHGFDLSVDTDGHLDLFRCISFDVDDFHTKLDAAKVLTYDARDVREEIAQAEIISVLYPPVRNPFQEKKVAFQESRAILRDEGI